MSTAIELGLKPGDRFRYGHPEFDEGFHPLPKPEE